MVVLFSPSATASSARFFSSSFLILFASAITFLMYAFAKMWCCIACSLSIVGFMTMVSSFTFFRVLLEIYLFLYIVMKRFQYHTVLLARVSEVL